MDGGEALVREMNETSALGTASRAGWCLLVTILVGCQTVPVTGRKRILLVSESREMEMGRTAFQQTLASEKPSTNQPYIAMVNRVGQRLAHVANRPDYDWEFRVIESPQQNAFALPGGKVAVYEGIMPICETEGGLAVVMSHEVAHALARHGAERLTHGLAVNGLETALGAFTQSQDKVVADRLLNGFGIASKYGFVLPYSRKHELEADELGLVLMAQAGYDPNEAPRLWRRFAGAHRQSPPEFLSTHPNDEQRAAALGEQLSRAIVFYVRAPEKFGRGESILGSDGSPVSSDSLVRDDSTRGQPQPTNVTARESERPSATRIPGMAPTDRVPSGTPSAVRPVAWESQNPGKEQAASPRRLDGAHYLNGTPLDARSNPLRP